MTFNATTRTSTRQADQLVLVATGLLTICLGGRPSLAQVWGGSGMHGAGGGGVNRPGRIGMGSSDQHFMVMMIPHHAGAIAMADLALIRARRPEIKALAQSIKTSQSGEIVQMRIWYRQWYGLDVPAWPTASGWGWQGGMGMHGGTDLAALSNAKDFDRAFIEQMIPHHQMGVMMASMAQVNSQHPELRQLQQAMVRVQSDEIQQMEQWYWTWYSTRP